MVRLTITKTTLAALQYCKEADISLPEAPNGGPSLEEPELHHPITHSQVIALSKALRDHYSSTYQHGAPSVGYDLDSLLRGSTIYVDPPKPKPKPSPEYLALMASLRTDAESLAYTRMLSPNANHLAGPSLFPAPTMNDELDELTFSDINRQLTLIINILISIVACAIALWMVASRWSVGARLGLAMGGGGLVGAAEVVVYLGYIRRVGEAKGKEKVRPEVRGVVESWTIEPRGKNETSGAREGESGKEKIEMIGSLAEDQGNMRQGLTTGKENKKADRRRTGKGG